MKFMQCKCGHEKEAPDHTQSHEITCEVCKRTGCFIETKSGEREEAERKVMKAVSQLWPLLETETQIDLIEALEEKNIGDGIARSILKSAIGEAE